MSTEIPRLSVVMRYAAQNHTVNGIGLLTRPALIGYHVAIRIGADFGGGWR